MSVYQNDLVTEHNTRESRRLGRGSSGSGGVGAELSDITKEQREMRTSSATAGITNTEYKLLNMTGTGPGIPVSGLNLSNQNHNYLLCGGNSVTHALSGASRISGLSGGESSVQTATGGISYSNKLGMNIASASAAARTPLTPGTTT